MEFKKILIAIDESIESEKAAACGFSIAHDCNAEVVLVNIMELIESSAGDAGLITGSPFEQGLSDDSEFIKIQEEASDNIIDRTIKKFAGELKISHHSVYGSAAESVVGYSDKLSTDLIVIGTRSRTGLDRILMGSVAEHVIRHSKVPVLVVPL